MSENRWLTLQQTADYLAVPMSYIYRKSHENRLPGLVRLGAKTLRVDRQKLDNWLEAQTKGVK